ncbi:MAG: TonB-dependent receptor domain-containing protein [Opitutaceae bacterium]
MIPAPFPAPSLRHHPSRVRTAATFLPTLWLTLAGASLLPAPEAGTVTGRVKHAVTGAFLHNARVSVLGGTQQVFSDEAGIFRIAEVPAGAARVEAFYTGLDAQVAEVVVRPGRVLEANFELSSVARYGATAETVRLDPFRVAAARETDIESIAINEQRFSPNLKHVISTESMGDAVGGSAGDFLRFLPGVAGTFAGELETEAVQIRGFPSNYSVVSYDGVPLAGNALQGGREFSTSRMSVNSVSRVEVTKVPLPSNPADTMSGSINLVSKSAFERSTAEFKYRAALTTNGKPLSLRKTGMPANEDDHNAAPDFNFDYTLPVSPGFGLVFTGLYSTTLFRTDSWYTDYLAAGTGTGATPANPYLWRTRNVEFLRGNQRHGGSVRADGRLGPHGVISAGYVLTYYNSRSNQSVFTPTAGNNGTASVAGGRSLSYTPDQVLGATGRGDTPQTFSFADNNSVTQNGNVRYRFNDGTWRIESLVSHSDSKSWRRNSSRGFFNGLNVALATPSRVNLLRIGGGRVGDFEVFDNGNRPVDPFDIASYILNTASTNPELDMRTKITVGELDFRRELTAFAFPAGLQIGGLHRVEANDERRRNGRTYNFAGINGSRSAAPFLNERYHGAHRLEAFPDKPPVPWVSPHRVLAAFASNPAWFTQTLAQQRTTASNNLLDSKYLKETVSAAYVQAEARLLRNRLHVVTGVRYEETTDLGLGPLQDPDAVFTRNANGTFARTPAGARIRKPEAGAAGSLEEVPLIFRERASRAERSYRGAYPSLHLNFNATENLVVRGAYARTYGRPDYANIVPNTSVTQDDDLNAAPGTTLGRITYSNIGLKPWTADNYDLSLEYYTPQGGILSGGVFWKEVSNFFGTVVKDATAEDLALLGLDGRYLGWRLTSQFNSGAARILGTEINVRQSLAPLGGWGRHVTVFANATKLDLSGSGLADFTGFLPESVNWGATVLRNRATLSAKWNYRGTSKGVQFPNVGPEAFRYPQARLQLDASLAYQLGRRNSLFLNVRNVTNALQEEHIYQAATPGHAREFLHGRLGRIISLGVKGSF